MLIAELRKARKETSDQATANTRTTAELEVALQKQTYLKPTIASRSLRRHGICISQNITRKRRRASKRSVAKRRWAQPSKCRNRRLEDATYRSDLRLLANNAPSGAAAATAHLATPRGVDNVLSGAPVPGSTSTPGMFSPASTGLESGRTPAPSSATVDSDAS